jgi:hypothetical protein
MGMILRIYSEFYTNLIKACHSIEVLVGDAVFVVASTWILNE